jgi:hypothetical protein
MLIARTEPPVLRALPGLIARLGRIPYELDKLDAMLKLIAALAPVLRRPRALEADDTSDA